MSSAFDSAVADHRATLDALTALRDPITILAERIVAAYADGGKVLFCGNGGSATDADHLAAELVGRFQRERRPYPALSLATSHAGVTAIANDYGFESIFSRQVEAFGQVGDVLVAISTSGKSPNVVRAAQVAKAKGMFVSAWTGQATGPLHALANHAVSVPSSVTARIQEMHILLGHILCDMVETALSERLEAS